jgi:acyl-CoA synthetase (AMP-forming)/AMP-acid ligase II
VLAPNVPAMYEMHFGVPMCGAVLNTINTRLDARTVSILLHHSESKLIFCDILYLPLLHDTIRLLPSSNKPPQIIPIEDPYECNATTHHYSLTYEKLIESGDPQFDWIKPSNDLYPIVLNYTSGTTSAPKGVVHCHRGIFIATLDSLVTWSVPIEPVYLWTLPMFHSNGWTFPWGMAVVGGTNICLRRFNASTIFSAFHEHKVTHMCAAPIVLSMLCNASHSIIKPLLGPVNIMTAASSPPATVLNRTEAMGFVVSHGYGLTETGGIVMSCAWKGEWNNLAASERARLKARQGVSTPSLIKIDVLDVHTGKSVVRDGVTSGEIVVKGACVMLGYLKDEKATNAAIKDGWFYTGDVGVVHPDGYVEIKDRSKDVIISGGENISSVEVESMLYSHPVVNEAAVVARPDEFWGETPCAFVSLVDGIDPVMVPTEKEMIEWCRERMPHYMVPKTVVFKEELPKTSTGKIQKYMLRNLAREMATTKMSRL